MTSTKSTRLTREQYQSLRLLREADRQQNHDRPASISKTPPDTQKSISPTAK